MKHLHILCLLLSAATVGMPHRTQAQAPRAFSGQSFLERAVLSFKGVLAGPSLGTSVKRNPAFDSTLKIGYTLAPDVVAGIALNADIIPTAQGGASLKPPHLLIEHANLYRRGDFRWNGDLRLYLPVGDRAAFNATQCGLRTTQTVTYRITPRLELSSENAVRFWAFGNGGSGGRSDVEVRISPNATYRFSNTVAATLWSDLINLDHPLAAAPGLVPRLANLQPGMRFDFGRSLTLNPYLNFIPGNLSVDSTTVGLVLNARMI